MFNDIIIKMHLVKTCLFIITVTFMYKCNLIVNIKISVRALLVLYLTIQCYPFIKSDNELIRHSVDYKTLTYSFIYIVVLGCGFNSIN